MSQQMNKKPKTKSKSRRSMSKPKPCKTDKIEKYQSEAFQDQIGKKPVSNDPKWYEKNPELVHDAANLSFFNAVGARVDWKAGIHPNKHASTRISAKFRSIPGVCSLHYVPDPGLSTDAFSPVNVASRDIYSYVRAANSGAKNYDAPDLMMYLLYLDNAYQLIEWGRRAYGCMMEFEQRNRYTPETLVQAMSFSYNSLRGRLSDLRWELNQAIAKVNSFCVPNVMDFFNRHDFMNRYVFKDSATMKAQFYVFVPRCYYIIDEASKANKGFRLKFVDILNENGTVHHYTLEEYAAILKNVFDGMALIEDLAIMSGDIEKAYSDSGLKRLEYVDELYTTEYRYDEDVLNMIHNLASITLTHTAETIRQQDIQVDPDQNAIIYNPLVLGHSRRPLILNMPWDVVTPENVLEGSRLIAAAYDHKFELVGTEFITNIWVHYFSDTDDGWKYTHTQVPQEYTINTVSDPPELLDVISAINDRNLLAEFDWHPLLYSFHVIDDGGVKYVLDPIQGDINNYTVLSRYELTKLHTTALLSLFNVPSLKGR